MLKRVMLLIAFVAAFSVGQTAKAAEVRVMSFNIRYGAANDGDDSWPHRNELVVKTIRAFNPDLLGTQETLPFQADFIRKALTDYEYVGWSRDESPDGEQCGLLFRKDRFEQLDAGQFWLSEAPDEKASKSWDSSLPRVVTWVKLADRHADGAALLFVNTHFDHRGVEARAQSAQLVRNWIEDHAAETPVILTGDFNTPEQSAPWKTLTASDRLTDTWRIVNPQATESEGTFHGFTGKPGTGRIDWVLVSPEWIVAQAAIDRTEGAGRYPSDHFPVSAVLQRDR